jgi:hypothetical protein
MSALIGNGAGMKTSAWPDVQINRRSRGSIGLGKNAVIRVSESQVPAGLYRLLRYCNLLLCGYRVAGPF